MDDLISRAEAIDILTRMSTNHFYGHREQEAFKLGAEALKQRWIPVTERLPEESGEYLVSIGYMLFFSWFYKDDGVWSFINADITAWMPLPEPYKGGEAFTFIEGTPKENLYNYCPNCGARMEE